MPFKMQEIIIFFQTDGEENIYNFTLKKCLSKPVNIHFYSVQVTKKETGKPKFVEVRYISLLSLCLLVPSADSLCKQFGPRSGLTKRQVCSGYKLFDSLRVFLKEFFERFILEKSADD